MADLNFNKNDFDIDKINTILSAYCKENNLPEENLHKFQLVCEEFLSNLLFPNFDGNVNFSVCSKDGLTSLSFSYDGENYMTRINQTSILSLKILRNQTKEITADTQDGKTVITFKA